MALGRIDCLPITAFVEHSVANSNLLMMAIAHNLEELLVAAAEKASQRLAGFALDCQRKLWLFEIGAIEEL